MTQQSSTRPHPFSDAVAVWHMDSTGDLSDQGGTLSVNGKVRLGVELAGAERDASLARGGDGSVAEFAGGYLSVDEGTDRRLELPGSEMSICMRLQDPSGLWNSPLLGKFGGDEHASYYLACVDGARKPMYSRGARGRAARTPFHDLFSSDAGPKRIDGTTACIEFTWGAEPDREIVEALERQEIGEPLIDEAKNGVMKVNYPVALIGADEWHDVIVRFTGPKLELYIDGVLVDEEFPIGTMRGNQTSFLIGAGMQGDEVLSGFHGLVDHVALWDRALTDNEILALSGGSEEVARNDIKILGEVEDQLQYWRPRGHNTRAGDCMPFFHDGIFHLYFLVVRRNHHGKWQGGHGGLQIWHSSTTDLVHWKHHPVAIPISEQWEMWWGTGSFVFHEGTYYTLQKVPHMWENTGRGIQLATSTDGIHFTKNKTYPYLEGEDVDIFQDSKTGVYHLLTGKKLEPGEPPTIKRLYSENLLDWEEAEEPFMVADPKYVVNICPHLFEWKGWYYFFGGFTGRSGVWRSRNQFGPWTLQTPERLDLLAVPKTAEFPGDRRILAGFLEDHGWGGNLVFRDLVQNEDGSLGTTFPPDMIPASGDPINPAFEPLSSGVTGDGTTINFSAKETVEVGMLNITDADVRVTLTINPGTNATGFGLRLRARSPEEQCGELRFEPKSQRVQFADGDSTVYIEDVALLNDPFGLDIIIKEDIIDICIDNRRTMAVRFWNPGGNRIVFFAEDADVTFGAIEIRPLR
jgi:beta-fructofuranosidase